jgi:hypothetical protein
MSAAAGAATAPTGFVLTDVCVALALTGILALAGPVSQLTSAPRARLLRLRHRRAPPAALP